MSMILAPSAIPNTYAHDERQHVCGMCRNPWTTGNPNCPNATENVAKPSRPCQLGGHSERS